MTIKETIGMTLAAGAATVAVAQTDSATLEKALETLKTYDWGADREALKPIDQAIIATHDDAAARKALEKSLVEVLAGGISRSAQDYVCRKLRVVGTAAQSVKALAALLADEETSHIARYALERIPGEKATKAMREALPKVNSKLKPGIIGSLGVRRDKKSIPVISKLLGDSDIEVANAAAQSLGLIGTSAAAKELSKFAKKASANMKISVADARLVCAEQLLADGKKSEAAAMYKELKDDDQPSHVKAAAMKGILTAAIKK
ncbi:MAG: HEAT repeat domain-containing protein [Planctomycetes bacterium]|nr:HEAT repeat domain-containing protein [Planctomycetota bacterium]MBL7147024.1 HEAT repeat domain-containing protein [Phycisphaerae bacterium]